MQVIPARADNWITRLLRKKKNGGGPAENSANAKQRKMPNPSEVMKMVETDSKVTQMKGPNGGSIEVRARS